MMTDELADVMHRTAVITPPDLDRITRQGRRLVVRRRLAAGSVAVLGAVVLAAPFTIGHHGDRPAAPSVGVPTQFVPAAPSGVVAETDSKFYAGPHPHSASLGPEAIWVEAGDLPYRISYGFRDESTGRLQRAGEVQVPETTGPHVPLPAIPHQHGEPTYVGMFKLPTADRGAHHGRYSVVVESPTTHGLVSPQVGQSYRVLPGYLVFWVTASEELAKGTYAVENRRGSRLVSGGFQAEVD